MRYRSAGSIDPSWIGHRVTIRRRIEPSGFTDAVGVLTALDEDTARVRTRDGSEITIQRSDIVAARVIRPRA